MKRRIILAGAASLPALAAVTGVLPAEAVAAERWRYRRRRGRHGRGLLVRDIEGTAVLGRRSGSFEGDLLLLSLHLGRKLHASGLLDGEADLEGRRHDFELDIDAERFRRVGLDLSARRRAVHADLAAVELGRRLEVDPDSFRLDDIQGPRGDELEGLFLALAEALEDDAGWKAGRRRDADAETLVELINRLLVRYRHEVDASWRRRKAA